MAIFLGIDLGTSGAKLVLLDERNRVVAESGATLDVQRPQALWSEQDPADWWRAIEAGTSQLRTQAPTAWARVRAIGLSGQMHGAVVLGQRDEVLRPAILWNDGRAFEECDLLQAREPAVRSITGNQPMPGFTAPKLLWLQRHEPSVFDRIHRVLLPKDWVRLCLTGEAVSEMSDASGTLWLDVGARRWSEAMLAACGLAEAQMPRLVEGSEACGVLRGDVARAWGLGEGVIVAGGGGDNAASAVGVGAVRAGQGFVSLGTSGVIFVTGDSFHPRPERGLHAFAHALPGRWHQMAVMLSAASALAWATRLTGQPDERTLVQRAAALAPLQRSRAPLFLPYLAGERTPHNDPHASGVLVGLRPEHGAADVGHAVMEGVGFGLRDGLAALTDPGDPELALVGGGSRSDAWSQLLASILGRRLRRPPDAQVAAALGAARLAWMATGAGEETACPTGQDGECFEPDAAAQDWLVPRYRRFTGLYPALRDAFRA